MAAHHFSQRCERFGKGRARVVTNARPRWKESREERGVRRQRKRSGGERLFEDRATRGEAFERRRLNPAEAVDGQPIGPHGIERNDNEIPRAPSVTCEARHL